MSERDKTLTDSTKRKVFGKAGDKGGVGRNGQINEKNVETEKERENERAVGEGKKMLGSHGSF